MEKQKFKIHKAKDGFDKVVKQHDTLFPLPMKMLLISKSQVGCGKSNIILNLLVKPQGYRDFFKPENIYIFNPSQIDKKMSMMIEQLEIPKFNIFDEFDDGLLNELLDNITDQTLDEVENKEPISQKLIILDDCSFGNKLKTKVKNSAVSRLFSNGRHLGCSVVLTAQQHTALPTSARENCTVVICGNCSNRQLDSLADDINMLQNKKQFVKMFRDTTKERHSFMVADFCRKTNEMYLNSNFDTIDATKYLD